jgi:thiamine transporter ThiT
MFSSNIAGAILIGVEKYIPRFIQNVISFCVALTCAFFVTKFVWSKIRTHNLGFIRSALMGGFILGSIGFIAGFIGPIIFYPSSNQGPLLGIFITGPLGFILGLIAGAIYWEIKLKK